MKNVIISKKNIGETPLECLERVRKDNKIASKIPMTYAGRLDPMAEGVLIILAGEECKNKEKYLGLDKEYEIEILFGVETDSQDVLGLVKKVNIEESGKIDFKKYLGKFTQTYPMYSSKTLKGKQLHEYARAGEYIDEMPTKEVKIDTIEKLKENKISGLEIADDAIERILKVKGDFRQKEIVEEWQAFALEFEKVDFKIIKLRVKCGSGTYMRTLAKRIGDDAGVGGMVYSIKRTRVGSYG